jgi:ribosomal protein L37E
MNKENKECETCGGTSFTQGQMNNGYANLMPVNKALSFGSPLIFTFCKRCGEVASIQVMKPEKF